MKITKKISVIIPIFNENESVHALHTELYGVLRRSFNNFEIIYIDDGSTDGTGSKLDAIRKKDRTHTKIVRFNHNGGKSLALQAGFNTSSGDVIITMDGDLQDDPHEIPKLIRILDEGADIVSGWKFNRKDGLIKRQTSKIFNWFTNRLSVAKLHDHNCGLKAYRKEAMKNLCLTKGMHRFIPVLLATKGYRVTETPVHHRARAYGTSKYGWIRFIDGFTDYLKVFRQVKLSSLIPYDYNKQKIAIQRKIADLTK